MEQLACMTPSAHLHVRTSTANQASGCCQALNHGTIDKQSHFFCVSSPLAAELELPLSLTQGVTAVKACQS